MEASNQIIVTITVCLCFASLPLNILAKTYILDPQHLPSPYPDLNCSYNDKPNQAAGIMFNIKENKIGPGDTIKILPGTILLDGPLFVCPRLTVLGTMGSDGSKQSKLKRLSSWAGNPDNSYLVWLWDGTWTPRKIAKGANIGLLSSPEGSGPTTPKVTVADLLFEGNDSTDADIRPAINKEPQLSLLFLGGDSITVRNCELKHSLFMGMRLQGGQGIQVFGCRVDNTARDGIFIGGTRDLLVAGNVITRTRDNAIGFDCANVREKWTGPLVHGGKKSLITGNTIDNHSVGCYVFTGKPVKGYNTPSLVDPKWPNTFYASVGIMVTSNSVTATAPESVSVANNTIISSWRHGIMVDAACSHVTISNNKVIDGKQTGNHGICINGEDSYIVVEGNEVVNPGYYGIVVGPNCKFITIRDNKVHGATHEGIMVERCPDDAGTGKEFSGITLQRNKATGNGRAGIRVMGSVGCALTDNVVDSIH
jgi:parallel beta-helix repeat protein